MLLLTQVYGLSWLVMATVLLVLKVCISFFSSVDSSVDLVEYFCFVERKDERIEPPYYFKWNF